MTVRPVVLYEVNAPADTYLIDQYLEHIDHQFTVTVQWNWVGIGWCVSHYGGFDWSWIRKEVLDCLAHTTDTVLVFVHFGQAYEIVHDFWGNDEGDTISPDEDEDGLEEYPL